MKALAVAAMTCMLAACGEGAESPVPLQGSGVTILEPVPGQDRTVAYLKLDNRGRVPLTLDRVTSPQFAAVEMHATILDDGVAGMQPLDAITIAERSSIEFSAGDRHLMLIRPRQALVAGDDVTLEFHYDQPGLLILRAPMQRRLPEDL